LAGLCVAALCLASLATSRLWAFDLLLNDGYVIDPKNHLAGKYDVAIDHGKITEIAENISPEKATTVVDAKGLYVTPGLVDIHVHVYAGTGQAHMLTGDLSVYPDGHTLPCGVTTVCDAGTSGWRNFADFEQRVIRRSKTRVFAFLNIVGYGMSGESSLEQNLADMDSNITAHTALANRDVIVGIKTAHYLGPDWYAVDHAIEAGELAQVPVMVDFGAFRAERPFQTLVSSKMRPGDISTHCYNMHIPMFDSQGKVLPYLHAAQDRGVAFDVGHGCASFSFRQAIPAVQQGFWPNSISTDLHTSSMLGGMEDMSNLMSKFLNMGMPLTDVVARTTWNPANEIHHPELGNLSVGAPADVAVLKVETGKFGFVDTDPTRMTGTQKIVNELTVRDGAIVWDREGLAVHDWKPSNSPALHKQLVGK